MTVTFSSARADGAGGHAARVAAIVRGAQDVALLRLTGNVPVDPVPLADRMPAEGSRADGDSPAYSWIAEQVPMVFPLLAST